MFFYIFGISCQNVIALVSFWAAVPLLLSALLVFDHGLFPLNPSKSVIPSLSPLLLFCGSCSWTWGEGGELMGDEVSLHLLLVTATWAHVEELPSDPLNPPVVAALVSLIHRCGFNPSASQNTDVNVRHLQTIWESRYAIYWLFVAIGHLTDI